MHRIRDIQTITEMTEYLIDHPHFNWHNYVSESNYAKCSLLLYE